MKRTPGGPQQPPVDLLRPNDVDMMQAWKVQPSRGQREEQSAELVSEVKEDQQKLL
jgi:hypothetical protein